MSLDSSISSNDDSSSKNNNDSSSNNDFCNFSAISEDFRPTYMMSTTLDAADNRNMSAISGFNLNISEISDIEVACIVRDHSISSAVEVDSDEDSHGDSFTSKKNEVDEKDGVPFAAPTCSPIVSNL